MRIIVSLVVLAALSVPGAASADITVDGRLDADYGAALSTQDSQHPGIYGDLDQSCPRQPDALRYWATSELDQAFGYIEAGQLHLLLTGNLASCWTGEITYIQDDVNLFIDSQAGGQNPLRSDNPALGFYKDVLNPKAGLTFDDGFAPDYWLAGTVWVNDPVFNAYYAELPAGGGGAGWFLGASMAGGPGTFSGGTNPAGILGTIDNSNAAGVGAGCGAASGEGAVSGTEWVIPLSAIGDPTGCVRICALISQSAYPSGIVNQVLGPIPPGTCSAMTASAVNFAGVPGDQFFTVCPRDVRAALATWGNLKAIYR